MKKSNINFWRWWGNLRPGSLSSKRPGCLAASSHDVPVLVAAKLLKPLGSPPQNGIKFFATAELGQIE